MNTKKRPSCDETKRNRTLETSNLGMTPAIRSKANNKLPEAEVKALITQTVGIGKDRKTRLNSAKIHITL